MTPNILDVIAEAKVTLSQIEALYSLLTDTNLQVRLQAAGTDFHGALDHACLSTRNRVGALNARLAALERAGVSREDIDEAGFRDVRTEMVRLLSTIKRYFP